MTMEMLIEAVSQDSPFDLVLMDYMMPEQDGITTAKEIRNNPYLNKTPIIILTGYGADLEKQRAAEVSINAFLHKPISREVLLENIQMVLGSDLIQSKTNTIQQKKLSPELLVAHKILLVEDNEFNQILAREILENAGRQVETANNGREALELVDSTFDAILMDVQMPEIDGLLATILIRRCETHKNPKSREHQQLLVKLSPKVYSFLTMSK